jgi:hypothetical protein
MKCLLKLLNGALFAMFVALATHHGWKILHLRMKTMFLNGPIINEVYMTQPKGKEFWVAN